MELQKVSCWHSLTLLPANTNSHQCKARRRIISCILPSRSCNSFLENGRRTLHLAPALSEEPFLQKHGFLFMTFESFLEMISCGEFSVYKQTESDDLSIGYISKNFLAAFSCCPRMLPSRSTEKKVVKKILKRGRETQVQACIRRFRASDSLHDNDGWSICWCPHRFLMVRFRALLERIKAFSKYPCLSKRSAILSCITPLFYVTLLV